MVVSNPALGFLKREVVPPRHGGLRSFVLQGIATNRVLGGYGVEFVTVKLWVEKRAVWMKREHDQISVRVNSSDSDQIRGWPTPQ
jgi:hypothetical protein